MSNLIVLDQETGEKMPIVADKKMLMEYVLGLPDNEKAGILTKVNYLKKLMANLEKAIKDYAKPTLEFIDGIAYFENWKISKFPVRRFSETALKESGNSEDIKLWSELKEKYSVVSEVPRWS